MSFIFSPLRSYDLNSQINVNWQKPKNSVRFEWMEILVKVAFKVFKMWLPKENVFSFDVSLSVLPTYGKNCILNQKFSANFGKKKHLFFKLTRQNQIRIFKIFTKIWEGWQHWYQVGYELYVKHTHDFAQIWFSSARSIQYNLVKKSLDCKEI